MRRDIRQTLLYLVLALLLALALVWSLQHQVSRTFIELPTPTSIAP